MPIQTQLYLRPLILLFVLTLPGILFSQEKKISYDASMMDFWTGDWKVSWTVGDIVTHTGENTVLKILGDRVVEENFRVNTGPNKGYVGKSWSVFNTRTNEWKQTWVDNSGAYLDFTGQLMGDSVIFKREMRIKPQVIRQQRMVFCDIEEDRLTWKWQHRDEGEANRFGEWRDDWVIYYEGK